MLVSYHTRRRQNTEDLDLNLQRGENLKSRKLSRSSCSQPPILRYITSAVESTSLNKPKTIPFAHHKRPREGIVIGLDNRVGRSQ